MKRITLIGFAIVGLGLAFAPLTASAASLNKFDAVMLNPQPLPPKEKVAYLSHGDEVMLLDPEEYRRICILRRVLQEMNAPDAMELLVTRLQKTKTNAEFLMSMNMK